MKDKIINIIGTIGKDPGRLMDILLKVQADFGCVSDEVVSIVASELNIS